MDRSGMARIPGIVVCLGLSLVLTGCTRTPGSGNSLGRGGPALAGTAGGPGATLPADPLQGELLAYFPVGGVGADFDRPGLGSYGQRPEVPGSDARVGGEFPHPAEELYPEFAKAVKIRSEFGSGNLDIQIAPLRLQLLQRIRREPGVMLDRLTYHGDAGQVLRMILFGSAHPHVHEYWNQDSAASGIDDQLRFLIRELGRNGDAKALAELSFALDRAIAQELEARQGWGQDSRATEDVHRRTEILKDLIERQQRNLRADPRLSQQMEEATRGAFENGWGQDDPMNRPARKRTHPHGMTYAR